MSRFVTVTEFAQRLTDAGCRVRRDGEHGFTVIAGRGPKSRSAYVCFYRGGGFYYAQSGAATRLRSMRAVLAWLRLIPETTRQAGRNNDAHSLVPPPGRAGMAPVRRGAEPARRRAGQGRPGGGA